MVVWSTYIRFASRSLQKIQDFQYKFTSKNVNKLKNAVSLCQTRNMSSEMFITASRWQWHKTKDWLHFYTFLMAIPLGIITFYINVFIGPATLAEIPEGYYPQYWEYYRHPISRFLARYFFYNPQKDYEKTLHTIYLESQIMEVRKLENKIMKLQGERQDTMFHTFLPVHFPDVRSIREYLKEKKSNN